MKKLIFKPIILIYKTLGIFKHTVLVSVFGFSSRCKHTPTCSEYFYKQVLEHGTIGGLLPALKRLFTCW